MPKQAGYKQNACFFKRIVDCLSMQSINCLKGPVGSELGEQQGTPWTNGKFIAEPAHSQKQKQPFTLMTL